MNATGGIDQTGDQRIDGTKTKTAAEFVRFSQSERVSRCLCGTYSAFSPTATRIGDGPSLRAAYQAYRKSGGSFEALVTSILSSDSFISHPKLTAAADNK